MVDSRELVIGKNKFLCDYIFLDLIKCCGIFENEFK